MAPSVENVSEMAEMQNKVSLGLCLAYFWAPWAIPCTQMDLVVQQLSEQYPSIRFLKVEAEASPEISEKYEISSVPSFIFLKNGSVVDSVVGANTPELTRKVAAFASSPSASAPVSISVPSPAKPESDLKSKLEKLVKQKPVMLFMKGSPEHPRCGFSSKIVDVLNNAGAKFGSFNILDDTEVREGLKAYSKWPTYPQLYIDGQLIGGLDIVKEMAENGELADALKAVEPAPAPVTVPAPAPVPVPAPAPVSNLNAKLKQLIESAPIMAFIKGTPEEAKCGFSQQLIDLLKATGVPFASFNILTNNEVREGLKAYSNWPTYPQLYVSGKLVGGVDITKELEESGQLADFLKSATPTPTPTPTPTAPVDDLNTRLKKLIESDDVMLFMKGSPDQPKCGFSRQIVDVLNKAHVKFGSFDILNDNSVREGLKSYSKWPTYPQLYAKGKLIGGLDIVKELAESGDLDSALSGQ